MEQTIQSVLFQGYQNLQYIVIDGGSTDDSVEIIRRYSDKLAYWVSEKDSGQSEALNKGLARATGEIIGWLNSDDLLEAGALRRVAETIGNPAEARWLVGSAVVCNESGGTLFTRTISSIDADTFVRWPELWFPQQSTFFTRVMLDKVGALREGLEYCMDLDLWIRMYFVTQPTIINDVLSTYRFHDLSKCSRDEARVADEMARVLSAYKGLSEAAYSALVTCSQQSRVLRDRCDELEHRCSEMRKTIDRIRQHPVFGRALSLWQRIVNRDFVIE